MRKTTFTLAEAAAVLSCHKETLRRAIGVGELQAARLGREFRISRADLQAFWTAQGGGELFSPEPEAEEKEQPKPGEGRERAAKPRRPAGPEQLTLPT
jgi:excisionase family DNA binding protein